MNYHDFVNKFMHQLCIHLCIIYLMNHKELTQVQRFFFFIHDFMDEQNIN